MKNSPKPFLVSLVTRWCHGSRSAQGCAMDCLGIPRAFVIANVWHYTSGGLTIHI